VLERLLRIVAIVLSLIVAAGFVQFALDDVGRASSAKVGELYAFQAAAPTAAGEQEREKRNGPVREAIDDANDVLLAPFAGIADTAGSRWVQRGVPAFLALLVYGFGLGFLARFARGTAGRVHPQAR
jgi:hypothetical protein